jgi:hypothetical protein
MGALSAFDALGLLPAGEAGGDPRGVCRWFFRGRERSSQRLWHRYRVELYPHVAGFFSGIRDPQGHELEFPSAFRQSRRDGRPRGIFKLKFGGAP